MDTSKIGFYKVTIGGEEYSKSVVQVRDFLSSDYFVVRTSADGKQVSARLNPTTHRHAIARVERALAAKAEGGAA